MSADRYNHFKPIHRSRVQAFLQLLESTPFAGRHIEELRIFDSVEDHEATPLPVNYIRALLARLPALRTLSLSGPFDIASDDTTVDAVPRWQLDKLSLSRVTFVQAGADPESALANLLTLFSKVRSATLEGVTTKTNRGSCTSDSPGDGNHHPIPLSLRLSIHKLTFRDGNLCTPVRHTLLRYIRVEDIEVLRIKNGTSDTSQVVYDFGVHAIRLRIAKICTYCKNDDPVMNLTGFHRLQELHFSFCTELPQYNVLKVQYIADLVNTLPSRPVTLKLEVNLEVGICCVPFSDSTHIKNSLERIDRAVGDLEDATVMINLCWWHGDEPFLSGIPSGPWPLSGYQGERDFLQKCLSRMHSRGALQLMGSRINYDMEEQDVTTDSD